MATRAERMQQRIRGAGRGLVDDVSFELDLGLDEASSEIDAAEPTPADLPPPPPPQPPPPQPQPLPPQRTQSRSTPNTSVKRKKLDTDPKSPFLRHGSGSRVGKLPVPTGIAHGASAVPRQPDQDELQAEVVRRTISPVTTRRIRTPDTTTANDEVDDIALLPSAPPLVPGSVRSVILRRSVSVSEVAESPPRAPGTGRRRSVRIDAVSSSSTRLQQVVFPPRSSSPGASDLDPLSSPLAQRARRSAAAARRRTSTPLRRQIPQAAEADAHDELASGEPSRLSPSHSQGSVDLSSLMEPEPQGPEERRDEEGEPARQSSPGHVEPQEVTEDVAEEISATEAARRLGQKRPRQSMEELETEVDVSEDEGRASTKEGPAPKRRRKQTKTSPAKQNQGQRKDQGAATKSKPKSKPKEARQKPTERRRTAGSPGPEVVEVPVQRFTRRGQVAEGDDPDLDILTAEIPYAKRATVNCIDVLSQLCDEIIDTSLDSVRRDLEQAADAQARKECRVKISALEAYRAELQHRFLGHTIRVDHLHSLRLRVRHERKEKARLREEIMRVRAEREQVALRKDAVRARHEKERDELLNQVALSSAMHDIDLAVDRGRAHDPLLPGEEKNAELANLELLISRVSEQASTRSSSGGTLKQLRDFNAFLERAAVALEER
ncbi:hypothetical protein ACRALDRAFT_1082651 [Sodiomyces alcalophilus JCM 7366]|uniref:uncharacterized protein n=1 Tax=Sodiomyces alcalophilus JCM 7366 TaxID=591952 RepID=UPI0039B6D7F7